MAMKDLFSWARPKSEAQTVEQAEAQHAAAANTLESARAQTQAAQDEFDEAGSSAAAQALDKAREVERHASEHVARAERILAAARKAEDDAHRQATEHRLAQLDAELSHEAVVRAVQPIDDEETDLLRRVAEIRARRFALARDLSAIDQERDGCLIALGREIARVSVSGPRYASDVLSLSRVAEGLERTLHATPDGHVRRRILRDLIGGLKGVG